MGSHDSQMKSFFKKTPSSQVDIDTPVNSCGVKMYVFIISFESQNTRCWYYLGATTYTYLPTSFIRICFNGE